MKNKTVSYSLRLPVQTLDWLILSAKESRRSNNSEVIFKLNSVLDKEFSEQDVALFKQSSPTKLNTEVFQFRLDEKLKESLRMHGTVHRNSLNQEIVMRLFFAQRWESSPTKHHGIQESKVNDFEDAALTIMFKKLSPKHKKAVMNLIRDLSD